MRKIIFQMLISYEGFYREMDRDIDWGNVDYGFNKYVNDFLSTVDTLTFGQENDKFIGDTRTSETLQKFEWNNTLVVKIFVLEEILALKQQPDIDVTMFGNSDLTIFLVENNIMNEFKLMINPVVFGNGKILSQNITYE